MLEHSKLLHKQLSTKPSTTELHNADLQSCQDTLSVASGSGSLGRHRQDHVMRLMLRFLTTRGYCASKASKLYNMNAAQGLCQGSWGSHILHTGPLSNAALGTGLGRGALYLVLASSSLRVQGAGSRNCRP